MLTKMSPTGQKNSFKMVTVVDKQDLRTPGLPQVRSPGRRDWGVMDPVTKTSFCGKDRFKRKRCLQDGKPSLLYEFVLRRYRCSFHHRKIMISKSIKGKNHHFYIYHWSGSKASYLPSATSGSIFFLASLGPSLPSSHSSFLHYLLTISKQHKLLSA